VKRGAPNCLVMADMPFMSYQACESDAMRNAGQFMTDGLADAVKLEVDRRDAGLVERLVRAGIPIVAHIGFRPQQMRLRGAIVAGKSAADAASIVADAVALEAAGASVLLLEAAPAEVAERVVEKTTVPLIGCGAGPACHGQIVVLQDILGLTPRQPAFAQPVAPLGESLMHAVSGWAQRVRARTLGEHPYVMNPGESERF
jgi:3-methyl-2-oxobutanoate hydroxymethyltransferase